MWCGAVVVAAALCSGGAGDGRARLLVDGAEESSGGSAAAFLALAACWEAADHTCVADLVSSDGVQIVMGPVADRQVTYSPRQAFYFFRNLFQTSDSESFSYLRRQEDDAGGQVRAVVRWRFRRHGDDEVQEVRLVLSLAQRDDGWRLTEIRAIR
jgi:hypothetical protein